MLEYLLASTLYTGEESLPSSRNRVCRAPGAARRVFLDILVTSRQNHGRQAKRLGPDSSTGAGAGSGVAGGGHLEKKKNQKTEQSFGRSRYRQVSLGCRGAGAGVRCLRCECWRRWCCWCCCGPSAAPAHTHPNAVAAAAAESTWQLEPWSLGASPGARWAGWPGLGPTGDPGRDLRLGGRLAARLGARDRRSPWSVLAGASRVRVCQLAAPPSRHCLSQRRPALARNDLPDGEARDRVGRRLRCSTSTATRKLPRDVFRTARMPTWCCAADPARAGPSCLSAFRPAPSSTQAPAAVAVGERRPLPCRRSPEWPDFAPGTANWRRSPMHAHPKSYDGRG